VITIDTLLGERTAAGIKVDVEGFEIEVLRGCHRALSTRRIMLIQLEWNMGSMAAIRTDRRPVRICSSATDTGRVIQLAA
jgi:hypothetical protein